MLSHILLLFFDGIGSFGNTGCHQLFAKYVKTKNSAEPVIKYTTSTPVELTDFEKTVLRTSYFPPENVLVKKDGGKVSIVIFPKLEDFVMKVVKTQPHRFRMGVTREYKGMQLVKKIRGTMQFYDCWEMEDRITYRFKRFNLNIGQVINIHKKKPKEEYLIAMSRIFKRLTRYLISMHRQNITHGDIKLDNAMCMTESCSKPVFVDFGMCSYDNSSYYLGTNGYIGPEAFSRKKGRTLQTKALDVWAMGIVALYIVDEEIVEYLGNLRGQNRENLMTREEYEGFKAHASRYLSEYSEDTKNLLFKMCAYSERERPTARELHKRVKELGDKAFALKPSRKTLLFSNKANK